MTNADSTSRPGQTIGELAVKHGLIGMPEFEKAMKACRGLQNPDEAVPEYLMAQGMITEEECRKLAAIAKAKQARQLDVNFGQMAIQKGFITPSILQLALDEQTTELKTKKRYTLLGNILVDAGMLTPQQRDIILTEQNRYRDDEYPPLDTKSSEKTLHSPTDTMTAASGSVKPSDHPTPTMPHPKNYASSEVFPSGIKLIIQQDGNAAFLLKTDDFKSSISIGQIKEVLASRNILHGVVDDKQIQHFIDADIFHGKAFTIAEGNAPNPTQNATIKYFFTHQRLTAGTIREDGTIDFRERGDIPQVKQGDVLAVKKDAIEGKVGKNIFNDTIRVLPARDVRLKAGKGTYLSADRLQVIAAVSGHPKISRDGTIFVYESFVVQGDVDYETGNIDYQGDVVIRGCIQSGFKVKGNNIKAESIDGATVIAEGNIAVSQGITDATVSTRGSLAARFIQTSTITCLGDLGTDKEVVDSQIECSGTVTVNGVVIHSRISAKMGVYARQIGMEKAAASTIRVGIDSFAVKEAERLGHSIEEIKKEEQTLMDELGNLHDAIHAAQSKIERISVTRNRYDEERMELLTRVSEMDDTEGNREKSTRMQAEINRLIKSGDELNLTIHQCRETIRKKQQETALAEKNIKKERDALQTLMDEKQSLTQWTEKNPGFAMIKVEGKLMAGTKVFGCHSEETIKSSVSAVVLKEDLVSRPSGRDGDEGLWKMYITRL